MKESVIQAQAILDINRELSYILTLWRSNTGAAKIGDQLVRFGLPGQADSSGIMKPFGTRVEIEFKAPGKKQSEKQKNFQKMVESHGGLYYLIDSLDNVPAVIASIKKRYEELVGRYNYESFFL
jgi:hypothetical protein